MVRFWDAVASAEPHANNLHLAPTDYHTNTSSLIFSGRVLFLTPNQLKQEVKVSEYEKTGSRRQAATRRCLCRTHSPTGGQGENITPQDARRKQKKTKSNEKVKK